ncbi:MAG: HAD-IB family phosphatase [Deltaproteobacteria bacterium]|nr:HAD-IB family phosphatase [Deltaproteobacteria bacterium]
MISFSAIGLYTPGVVARITGKIFEMNGNIVDVEENCRRGLFSIFLVVDFTASPIETDHIITALKGIEKEADLKIILAQYDEKAVTVASRSENHLVTIIGVDRPGIIAKVSSFFHSKSILIEKCRMIARGRFFSMEMVIDTRKIALEPGQKQTESLNAMKKELKLLCTDIDQSVVIQSENIYRRNKKLVVFDVESSLVQHRSLKHFIDRIRDRVATQTGVPESDGGTHNQMQALVDNARFLKGLSVQDFEKLNEILQLNPGTIELIKILKSMGFKIALLSSGFNFLVKKIFETAGVDYAFSNSLELDENGITTGRIEEPVITSDTKSDILDFIMSTENIKPDQVIAVGDGSQSSHFIENVGLSIAIKPETSNTKTDGVITSDKVLNVLYCLGMTKEELEKFSCPSAENET